MRKEILRVALSGSAMVALISGRSAGAADRPLDCGWFADWKQDVAIWPDRHYHSSLYAFPSVHPDEPGGGGELEWESGPIDGEDVHDNLEPGHTRDAHQACL
jgi:hypothetical protein